MRLWASEAVVAERYTAGCELGRRSAGGTTMPVSESDHGSGRSFRTPLSRSHLVSDRDMEDSSVVTRAHRGKYHALRLGRPGIRNQVLVAALVAAKGFRGEVRG